MLKYGGGWGIRFALGRRLPGRRGGWRGQREGAVRTAFEQGALQGNPGDIPESLLAALWCDVALQAEEAFWAKVREHADELGESEPWDENLRRSRAH